MDYSIHSLRMRIEAMNSIVENRIKTLLPLLDEKQKRVYLATEAEGLGYGGLKAVHKLTGVSMTTIIRGKRELQEGNIEKNRVRKSGGGRKAITQKYNGIQEEIEKIVGCSTVGNPGKILLWTTKSLRNIEKALSEKGFVISHDTIGNLLKDMGYSLQQNKKMLQVGVAHPDRNAQFEYINKKSVEFVRQEEPVISVDTKKKELIGNFKNSGAEYSPKKEPSKVLDHDFLIKELGKVAPYGIYDIGRNEGFVNLGISHDTAEFAVDSILRWWQTLGRNTYPHASRLYINSDNGGSNGSRVRLWKKQLQEFANITRLDVHVSHFPPGTSKWNKIEHKMFCFISKNWRGRPLISIETVIELISNTTTSKGLKIVCVENSDKYELGTKVTDEEFAGINITRDAFHGDWNYIISPKI
jgi:transposase